jgi:hypothetical protein
MRQGISVTVSAADRLRLEAVVANRNSPQKHVWRARIMLLTGDGLGTVEIMRRTGKSKTAVWRWQERFMTAGVDGLLRDKTRPPRIPPLHARTSGRRAPCSTANQARTCLPSQVCVNYGVPTHPLPGQGAMAAATGGGRAVSDTQPASNDL